MTQQERIYNIATELTQGRRAIDLKHAMELFESIPEYKDASSCAEACKKRLELLEKYDVYKQEQTSRKTIDFVSKQNSFALLSKDLILGIFFLLCNFSFSINATNFHKDFVIPVRKF